MSWIDVLGVSLSVLAALLFVLLLMEWRRRTGRGGRLVRCVQALESSSPSSGIASNARQGRELYTDPMRASAGRGSAERPVSGVKVGLNSAKAQDLPLRNCRHRILQETVQLRAALLEHPLVLDRVAFEHRGGEVASELHGHGLCHA